VSESKAGDKVFSCDNDPQLGPSYVVNLRMVFAATTLLACGIAFYAFVTRPTHERNLLPRSATDVYELHTSHPPLHQITAGVSKKYFDNFTEALGLRPVEASDSLPKWVRHDMDLHWSCLMDSPPAFVGEKNGNIFQMASYIDGRLYYQSEY